MTVGQRDEPASDAQVVARVLGGDREAYALLVARHCESGYTSDAAAEAELIRTLDGLSFRDVRMHVYDHSLHLPLDFFGTRANTDSPEVDATQLANRHLLREAMANMAHGGSMAVLGIPMLLGPIGGPILGGWLIEVASWHWIFLINLPIGALVTSPGCAGVLEPGDHGTTFGGNPLAMRAGVETLRIMEEDGLLENASQVGAHDRGGGEDGRHIQARRRVTVHESHVCRREGGQRAAHDHRLVVRLDGQARRRRSHARARLGCGRALQPIWLRLLQGMACDSGGLGGPGSRI